MASLSWQDLRYVQIGGAVKSGTSLMSSLLDGHPQIIGYPGETGNTGYFFPPLADPATPLEQKVSIVSRRCYESDPQGIGHIRYREIGDHYTRLCQDAGDDFRVLHFLLTQAYYEVMEPEAMDKAQVWLDKSPGSHVFAERIFEMFPNAKFIHMLREPKDNFAAIGGKLLRDKTKREAEKALWRYRLISAHSFYHAERNLARFGAGRYLVLRFEDLCTRPQEIIPDLCRFLGIEHRESLYSPTRSGRPYSGNNRDGLEFTGIYAGNIGRWQERIPPYYAKVMERQPRQRLADFGYPAQFTPSDCRLAGLTHWLRTRFIPRGELCGKWPPSMLASPAPGVPGL